MRGYTEVTVFNFPQQEKARPIHWLPVDQAPRDGRLVAVLVPTREGGFIQGQAYYDAASYGGSWWWEGTSAADYFSDPISECNHGDPVAFMAPAAAS